MYVPKTTTDDTNHRSTLRERPTSVPQIMSQWNQNGRRGTYGTLASFLYHRCNTNIVRATSQLTYLWNVKTHTLVKIFQNNEQ